MDELYQVRRINSLHRLVLSVSLSLLFLLTIYLSIVVIFTGEWFFRLLESRLPQALLDLVPLVTLSQLWGWLRYLLLFLLVFLFVLLVYRMAAPRAGQGRYPYRGLSGRRGPCGRHRPVFLVYRPVFQVLPGLRVPGLGDYPAGVALPVWEHPDSGKCL